MEDVEAGEYDIRNQNLRHCTFSRSDPFSLREIQESEGIRFSEMTLVLKVLDGNMKAHPMSEEAFLQLLP